MRINEREDRSPAAADAASPVHATPKEIMAAFIAHDLKDGEWVEVGANLPVPRAGALLAHLTHGPNMAVMIAMTKSYLRDVPIIEDFEFITDVRATRWAEAYYPHDRLLSEMRFRDRGVFYCGGLQIDRHGNSNLIGIGEDYKRLRVRGPGGIGTCNATVHNARYHLVTLTHSPRVLVERCDYISAVGYGDGSPDFRARLGLPNTGPTYIITPLCIFEFHDSKHHAVLKSVHPGVSIDKVVARTGFEVEIRGQVEVTAGPSPEELEVLRTRIDTAGVLRA
jgi:glutaconate CoA-transferase subunit B